MLIRHRNARKNVIMQKPRTIVSDKRMELTIDRLCFELIEVHGDFSNTCILGIQNKGAILAERLHKRLLVLAGLSTIPIGKLDVTFYRDDFRTREKPLQAFPTEIDFLIEGKRVILVDDVLYTCLLYTSPSPRDQRGSRMPSSA